MPHAAVARAATVARRTQCLRPDPLPRRPVVECFLLIDVDAAQVLDNGVSLDNGCREEVEALGGDEETIDGILARIVRDVPGDVLVAVRSGQIVDDGLLLFFGSRVEMRTVREVQETVERLVVGGRVGGRGGIQGIGDPLKPPRE